MSFEKKAKREMESLLNAVQKLCETYVLDISRLANKELSSQQVQFAMEAVLAASWKHLEDIFKDQNWDYGAFRTPEWLKRKLEKAGIALEMIDTFDQL